MRRLPVVGRLGRGARIALGSLVSITACLALGELLARRFVPEPRPAWVTHPFLGSVRLPGYSTEKRDIDTGERFRFETDAFGFRGTAIKSLEKPPGAYRIFFVGASTTENGDLPLEATFPALVETELQRRAGPNIHVEVANAGLPGGTSAQALGQVALRILPFKPDLICVLDGVVTDFGQSLRDDWEPSTLYLAQSNRPKFREWLSGQSRLVAWLEGLKSTSEDDARIMFDKRLAARRGRKVLEPSFDLDRGLPFFAANERHLARLCRTERVACAYLTVPTLLKKDLSPAEDARIFGTLISGTAYNLKTETLLGAIERYDESTRVTAREEGALLVDLAKSVPADLDHFTDDVHFTRKGNQVVAQLIVDALLKDGSLPRVAADR